MLVIKCDKFENFSKQDIVIARQGLKALETCLNDSEFKSIVERTSFSEMNGMSKDQMFKLLLSGADMMDKREDGILDLAFSMYYSRFSRVIGWVTSGTRMIHVNKKYFGQPKDFASNAFHEYMHMLGFGHKSATDYGSVPYKMNELFSVWWNKRMEKSFYFYEEL